MTLEGKLEGILAMKPGRELNIQVAEQVIGRRVVRDEFFGAMERIVDPDDGTAMWSGLNKYSEDMEAAETVVDVMVAKGFEDAIYWADFGNGAYTEPEAICKAALSALSGFPPKIEPGPPP